MQTEMPIINELCIQEYLLYLKEQERSCATIKKYAHVKAIEDSEVAISGRRKGTYKRRICAASTDGA